MGSILLSSAQLNSIWVIFISLSGGLYPPQEWEPNALVVSEAPESLTARQVGWHSLSSLSGAGNDEIPCSPSRRKTLMDPALSLCMCREQPCLSLWDPLEDENLGSTELKGTNLPSNIWTLPLQTPTPSLHASNDRKLTTPILEFLQCTLIGHIL